MAQLRPSFASLVGLGEVLFAVLWAWVLLGEAMTGTQVVGGAIVLIGLAIASSAIAAPTSAPPAGPAPAPSRIAAAARA